MADRILVVGVSQYLDPTTTRLPGVANDVRAMAALLTSDKGAFSTNGMVVLVDADATKAAIESALDVTLGGATERDTVLVYLAGHGALDASDAYFVPYDGDGTDLGRTCIQLSGLKARFESTRSRRVVLMLDSCHSGGLIARSGVNARTAVERAVSIIAGEGRVVLAACTAKQMAYEDPATGHGDFTHAVLRGVRGEAADGRGEITINGLFDFVDHTIGRPDQKPMYLGHLTGRLVLSYREARNLAAMKAAASAPASRVVKDSAPWMALRELFLRVSECTEDGARFVAKCEAPTPAEEHVLRSMRGARALPFAYGTTAGNADVRELRAETDAAGKRVWHVELAISSARSGHHEMGTTGYSADELAEMRASRLLTGEPRADPRATRTMDTVEMLVAGLGDSRVTQSVFAEIMPKLASDPARLEKARLVAMHRLQATQCVDDTLILELTQLAEDCLHVRFEGKRSSGFAGPGKLVRVEGDCRLTM